MIFKIDRELSSILILSVCFMLLFAADATMINMQVSFSSILIFFLLIIIFACVKQQTTFAFKLCINLTYVNTVSIITYRPDNS